MKTYSKTDNPIVRLSFDFAIAILDYGELLQSGKKFVLANQLVKSGTSIGANVNEAQNAESKTDFVHKMKIAAKEADETRYWLSLCEHSEHYPNPGDLTDQSIVISKILNKIIGTSKQHLQR